MIWRIADAGDVDPIDLPPLADVVDPDALDALFVGDGRSEGTVRFDYCGHAVEVRASGDVRVETADEA